MRAFASAVILLAVVAAPAPGNAQEKMIAFETMYGVDGPFQKQFHHPIRHIKGDDLPWEIESADGFVDVAGHVVVHVRGLVFKDDASVPEELRGINDEDEFRALVSCITEEEEEESTPLAKVLTDGFAATSGGDADIDDHVELPNPCVAPIVFILGGGPGEKLWFAVSGFESEEEEE
jgi:hypothetical protein